METYSIYNISKGERKKTKMKGKKFLAFSLTVAMLAGSALTVSAAGVADVFNAGYYADKYGDLKAAYGADEAALLKHFMTSGAKEGRVMSPILDVAAYRNAYADLNAAFGDNWDSYVDHYLTFGIREGRKAGVLFDLADYAAKNPDVKAAYGEDYTAIAKHYVNFGIKEGRPGGTVVKAATPAAGSGSSGNTGNGGTTTTPEEPVTPPVVKYGHEHNWDAMIAAGTAQMVEIEAPTCTHAGYINYRCPEMVICVTYIDGSVEWILSREFDKDLDAGDVFHGKTIERWTESQCSATTGRRTVAQLHHSVPASGAYIVDHPTCTQPGVATYVCETCGTHVDKEAIPALGHAMAPTKTVTATSCDETGKGYTEQTCQRCGIKQQINVVYKHSVAKYTTITDATCFSEGEERGYCSVCKKEDVRKIAITPHPAEQPVDISVDTYVDDGTGNSVPAHATYQVTYCTTCHVITAVSADVDTVLTRTACTDTDGDGLCDGCKRPVNRTLMNGEKLYKVGEYYNNTIVQ